MRYLQRNLKHIKRTFFGGEHVLMNYVVNNVHNRLVLIRQLAVLIHLLVIHQLAALILLLVIRLPVLVVRLYLIQPT